MSTAEKISTALYQNLRPGHFPKLYLESGRGLIDEAGYLVTSVVASKRLPDGRKAYVADAGINLLYTAFWYNFNLELDRPVSGMNEPSIIYGPMCMNIDIINEGTMLPPLERGTRLILSPVGAYNVTQSMQFIEYRPNVVLVGEDGQVDVIREKEDLSDIENRERLPERLRPVSFAIPMNVETGRISSRPSASPDNARDAGDCGMSSYTKKTFKEKKHTLKDMGLLRGAKLLGGVEHNHHSHGVSS